MIQKVKGILDIYPTLQDLIAEHLCLHGIRRDIGAGPDIAAILSCPKDAQALEENVFRGLSAVIYGIWKRRIRTQAFGFGPEDDMPVALAKQRILSVFRKS